MRFIKHLFGGAVALAITSGSTGALAERCAFDFLIDGAEAKARNAWAVRWGYLLPHEAAALNLKSEYIGFINGCYRTSAGTLCSPSVPLVEMGPFVPGLIKYGFCAPGCYTSDQRVLFEGSYQGIEDAASAQSRTVSALSEGATLSDLSYSEQPIEQFVSGATEEIVYVLHGDSEQRVEVTSGHPMVRSDGLMVKAADLREGDMLLSDAGKPIRVIKIESFLYKGTAWNIRPKSDKKSDNIFVAEGFLTGSQRFQSDWANEDYRLFVRGRVDAEAILEAEPK